MRLYRYHLHQHALAFCALLLALVALGACGSAPLQNVPGGTVSPRSSPHIIVRSASVQVLAQAPSTQVSAACQPNEQMIGGGFSASDTFEYDVKIASSYPSSADHWTVDATSSPAFTLQVEAYCLTANPTLGIQIIHAPITPGGRVACPADTHLLGGGFQSDTSVAASRPASNGWYAATIGASGQVFALCATHDISSTIASIPYNPHSTQRGEMPSGAEIACPPGQTATAGGFSAGDLIVASKASASEASASPRASWTITTGGDADVTLNAVCATLGA